MADTLPSRSGSPPARRLAARVFAVLTSPRAAYADVAAYPAWLGVVLAVLVAMVAPTMWLLSTEVGQRAGIDEQLQTLESVGVKVTDDMYEQIDRNAPYLGYIAAAGQIVGLPVITLVIAGIAFATFNGALGADATFRQVFAVVAHSSVVTGLHTLFSTPLNFARQSLSSPTSLAAVLPFFEDNTFGASLLGSIDLFLIWWIVSLAIGLGVLYKRRTAPILSTMLIAYGAIAFTISALKSMLAGA